MARANNWPGLKRFKTMAALKERAEKLYPDRPALQEKWVASVVCLRNECKKGWVGDEKIPSESSAQVLKLRPGDRMVEVKRGEGRALPQD